MNSYRLAQKIYPRNQIKRIEEKMNFLDLGNQEFINSYYKVEFWLFLLFFCFSFLLAKWGVFLIFLGIFLVPLLHEKIFLDEKIRQKRQLLEKSAIFFLQILALTLENQKDILLALTVTCEHVNGLFSKEVQGILKDVQTGFPFEEAIARVRKRMPSKELDGFFLSFLQKDFEGTDFQDTLKKQIATLQEKYFCYTYQKIEDLYWKLGGITCIFLFLVVVLVLFVPMFLKIL